MPNPITLRDYADIASNPVARIPYLATDALLQTFFLWGDRNSLQLVCDEILNKPAGGKVRFTVSSSLIVYNALYVPRMQSEDPLDYSKGYVPESDIGFWMLVYGGNAEDLGTWDYRWLPVFLFVDSGAALSGGREIFGYPKQLGVFENRGQHPSDASVSVKALAFQKFCPNEIGAVRTIFSLTRPDISEAPGSASPKQAVQDGLKTFRDALRTDARRAFLRDIDIDTLSPPLLGMPMIFLKQFRDVVQPNKACFQSIVAVDVALRNISGGGLFLGAHTLIIEDLASHKIADTLGIKAKQSLFPLFWAQIDFSVGFGKIVWS